MRRINRDGTEQTGATDGSRRDPRAGVSQYLADPERGRLATLLSDSTVFSIRSVSIRVGPCVSVLLTWNGRLSSRPLLLYTPLTCRSSAEFAPMSHDVVSAATPGRYKLIVPLAKTRRAGRNGTRTFADGR
jgi:hypothetical protein